MRIETAVKETAEGDLADLRAMVEATPRERLPRLIGDLEAARAAAWARLASPAARSHLTEDRLLSMPDVAARLGITEHQARELGRRGRLPIVRVGQRHVRVAARALEEWIRNRAGNGQPYTRR